MQFVNIVSGTLDRLLLSHSLAFAMPFPVALATGRTSRVGSREEHSLLGLTWKIEAGMDVG